MNRKILSLVFYLSLISFAFSQQKSVYMDAKEYADKGEYLQAISLLEEKVSINERDFRFYFWRGSYLIFKDARYKRQEALKDLLKAYPFLKDDYDMNMILGWVYSLLYNYKDAKQYLTRAYELADSDISKTLIVQMLVDNHYDSKEYLQSIAFSKQYSKNNELLLYYGMAHGRLGNIEESARYLQQALNSGELTLGSKLMYSKYLIIMGDYTEAQKYLDELIAIKDTHAVALAMNGYLYMVLGKMDKADQCFRETLKIDPNNEAAWQFLMYYWYLKGRIAEASTSYAMYIGLSQDLDESPINYDMQEIKKYLETDELFQVLLEARKKL